MKTEERMRTAPALAAKNFLARRFQMESCSHVADLEGYETRPAFPFALVRHAQNTVLIVPPCG